MSDKENQIPCIVGSGVVTSQKDMMRVLRGFDHVKYSDIIDNKIQSEDEAFVVEVFANDTESTIVFNRRIHINVENFEYLRMVQSLPGIVELIEGHRTLRLESVNDPFNNKDVLMSESIENRAHIEGLYEEDDIIFDDDF
jgi:hypothetical protein